MTMLAVTPLLVAAAAGLLPVAAAPTRSTFSPTLAVQTADLDLTTTDGRVAFDRRIARAAAHLCDPVPAARSAALDAAREACVAETIAGARQVRAAAIRADRRERQATAAVSPR